MIKLITEFPVKCMVCELECVSLNSLSAHLSKRHKIKSLEYTQKYLLNELKPICKCGCLKLVNIKSFAYSEYIQGHGSLPTEKYEEIGKKSSATKRSNRIYEYTQNPNLWIVNCDGKFGCQINCSNYNYFSNLCRKKELGILVLCKSCSHIGKIHSEEFRKKCRDRIVSENTRLKISEANRRRYETMTQDDRNRISEIQTQANIKAWKNASPEQRRLRLQNRNNALKKLTAEQKLEKNRKISTKIKERMKLYNGFHVGFFPAYNSRTIPYIVDILDVKYDTKFIHAESESGEFKIYDAENQKFYYADAYCPKQNIWIEFDEDWKFTDNILNDDHIFRENRIIKLLDCAFLRIKFSNKIFKPKNEENI